MNGIFIIFTLISGLRRGIQPGQIWQLFRSLNLKTSKTAFLLSICSQANLLTTQLHPSAFFYDWLAWQADAQILHLIEAWQSAPRNRQEKLLRKRLLLRLMHEQPLRPSDYKLLPGLNTLGITHNGRLTLLAKTALGLQTAPSPRPQSPWQIKGDALHIPPETNWRLAWELERFLTPYAPFTYRLDDKSLRLARQNGQSDNLIGILEVGLGKPLTGELSARILDQPSLQISTVTIVEFSSPAELRQARRSPTMRSHFERIISPRHAIVASEKTSDLMKLLQRRGIYAPEQSENPETNKQKRTHFPAQPLPQPLGPPVALQSVLARAIQLQSGIHILYSTPEAKRPEHHHITPLLLEERNGYTYLIAYSHNRHGQRMYRLDRMEIPGTISAR